jgi:hypothetical protein
LGSSPLASGPEGKGGLRGILIPFCGIFS